MVRLKVDNADIFENDTLEFQFHNGSIKRILTCAVSLMSTKFQFHNGSIKRGIRPIDSQVDFVFQFHNGSIKSKTALDGLTQFQFHNGSIKRGDEI